MGQGHELVYSNDFATRRLIGFDGREDRLVGTLSRNPVGIDGWTRLAKSTDDYFLVGGENPALGFETVGSTAAYAAHDLGGLFKSGTMTASFDMHAPSAFADGGYAVVWFGGDRFHESNLTGDADFYKSAAFGVGLNNKITAYSGNGIGGGSFSDNGTAIPNHWYRFVVKSAIKSGKSDVAVFDMGTSQPTLATVTPAAASAVATFSAVPFRMAPSNIGGISCLAVVVKSVKPASTLAADDSRLLIDNIRVEHRRSGMAVGFR